MTQHTPAPWIAATVISSVVGLPIVSSQGKPICTLLTVPKGFPNEDKHNAESLANAALIVNAVNGYDDLVKALEFYADHDNHEFRMGGLAGASMVDIDSGEKARAVLAKIKGAA